MPVSHIADKAAARLLRHLIEHGGNSGLDRFGAVTEPFGKAP